jgi:hypothetical protein
MLGVKSTTLNARFRRQHIPVRLTGRTSYLPSDQAVQLVELHRYALMGWPTLLAASKMAEIKPGTLKAWCEQGRLEGHIDLTKRLRLNPAEIVKLGRTVSKREPKAKEPGTAARPKPQLKQNSVSRHPEINRLEQSVESEGVVDAGDVEHARAECYVLPAPAILREARGQESRVSPDNQGQAARLAYDPRTPFSISVCSPGRAILYDRYVGTILGVIDDPYAPKIKVAFPDHEDPVMREVLLVVDRRKSSPF